MPSEMTPERRREIEQHGYDPWRYGRDVLSRDILSCLAKIDRLEALLGETQSGLPLTGETPTAAVIAAQENVE